MWACQRVDPGTTVLLYLYGQNHSAALWPDPDAFRPERFLDRAIGPTSWYRKAAVIRRTGTVAPART